MLEKVFALPNPFESVVRVPRVAASCLAVTESFHENPTWLVRAAQFRGSGTRNPWEPSTLARFLLLPM